MRMKLRRDGVAVNYFFFFEVFFADFLAAFFFAGMRITPFWPRVVRLYRHTGVTNVNTWRY